MSKIDRYSYKNYKDDRDCKTRKVINRSMYMILNHLKKPVVTKSGTLLIFYRLRLAIKYIEENSEGRDWRVKKIRLDVTTQ